MKKESEYLDYEDGTRVELCSDDCPELSEEWFKNAKRIDQLPEELRDGLRSMKASARSKKTNSKKQISFRFDSAIVDHLKRDVKGYNMRVEEILRSAMDGGLI